MWSVATGLDGTVLTSRAGSPTLQAVDQYVLSDQRSVRLEIKCAINVMGMNYPETTPTPKSVENCLHPNWSLAP